MKPKTITRNDIEELLSPLPQYYSVAFALYCCDDVKEGITDEASLKAIELTKLWLSSNGTAITQEELRDAANASYAASAVSASAASYASSAASAAATSAVYAAHAAASTAYYAATSAVYAAHAAASTAYAAASASASYAADASGNSESKLRQYYDYALSMIADMTELEKILYGVQG